MIITQDKVRHGDMPHHPHLLPLYPSQREGNVRVSVTQNGSREQFSKRGSQILTLFSSQEECDLAFEGPKLCCRAI